MDLVLQDALVPYEPPAAVDGVVHDSMSTTQDQDVLVVFGDLQDGRRVTCLRPSGTNLRGPFNRVRESYRIDGLLFGNYVYEDVFDQITFELDYLASWIDAPGLAGRDPRRLDGSIVDSFPIPLVEATVNGAAFKIVCSRSGSYGDDRIDLRRRVFVSVEPAEAGNVVDLLNYWASGMQDLLAVSLGVPVRFTNIGYRPTNYDPYGDRDVTAWLPLTQGISYSEPSDSVENIQNYTSPMIVRASPIESVPNMITGWFDTWTEHRNLIALLLSHYYAPFMYTTQRFGSIFQAVEGLHDTLEVPNRELGPAIHRSRVGRIIEAAEKAGVPPVDVEWAQRVLQAANAKTLWQKIDYVVRSTGEPGELVLGTDPNFGSTCATLRGLVSHPTASRDRTGNAVDMYWYGQVLTWVARITLLAKAGVTAAPQFAAQRFGFTEAIERLSRDLGASSS